MLECSLLKLCKVDERGFGPQKNTPILVLKEDNNNDNDVVYLNNVLSTLHTTGAVRVRVCESTTGYTFTLCVIFYLHWHRHQVDRTYSVSSERHRQMMTDWMIMMPNNDALHKAFIEKPTQLW